jgi:hypothetical protein
MRYLQGMGDGFHLQWKALDRAHTVCGDRLVETTPAVNRETAESAMLLSLGARRAIEMMREAEASTEQAASAVPAGTETRLD